MVKRKESSRSGPVLPKFQRVPLDHILEPELPARATMSDTKMAELVGSMREVGQIEPITLQRHNGMCSIITGHRRYLAARELKWPDIAALVYPEGSAKIMAMQFHENTVREDLNPAEEALWFAQAREKLGLDEDGLCKLFHVSANYLGSRFALLRGDVKIFEALQRGEIRVGVAHELNRIGDDGMRAYYLDCARRGDPPARIVHNWVRDWDAQRQKPLTPQQGAADTAAVSGDAAVGRGSSGEAAGPGASESSPQAPPFFGCQLCGGDRDPYNLLTIRIHKWEWDRIIESVERAARGA